jgi:PhoPQ-activated pathogenicity-related protein
MDRRDSSGIAALSRIEDPYADRDRLRLPTDGANAAGNRSFTPDSSRFDLDSRTGPKYLQYVPDGAPRPAGPTRG